jgi:hypothetical protein
MAGIEVGLRPDPNAVADFGGAIEPALDVDLGTDKNAFTDLERFEMFETDAAADFYSVTKFSCDGTPDGAAHQRIEFGIAESETVVVLKEGCAGIRFAEVFGEIELELWIGLNFAGSMDGWNHAGDLSLGLGHLES